MRIQLASSNQMILTALTDIFAAQGYDDVVTVQGADDGVAVICEEHGFSRHYTPKIRAGRILQDLKAQHSGQKLKIIKMAAYALDPAQNMLSHDGQETRLTDREKDILIYLHDNPDRAVGKDELLEKIWDYAPDAETHTLETHIYRLRQKIAEIGNEDLLITADEGYQLASTPKA